MLESADSARSTRSLPAGQGVKRGRHWKSNASCKNVMLDPKIFRQKMKKSLHIKKSLYLCNPKTEEFLSKKRCKILFFRERCRSGRSGRSRKPLTSLPGPRVRIPVFPLKNSKGSQKNDCPFLLYLLILLQTCIFHYFSFTIRIF